MSMLQNKVCTHTGNAWQAVPVYYGRPM